MYCTVLNVHLTYVHIYDCSLLYEMYVLYNTVLYNTVLYVLYALYTILYCMYCDVLQQLVAFLHHTVRTIILLYCIGCTLMYIVSGTYCMVLYALFMIPFMLDSMYALI